MSFILDALKRADQERRQEPLTVTFDSGSELHQEEPFVRRNLGPIIAAGFVLALVLALAGYFGVQAWRVPPSPTDQASVAITRSPAETPTPTPKASVSAGSAAVEPLSTKNEASAPETATSRAPASELPSPEPLAEIDNLYTSKEPTDNPNQAVEQLYLEPAPQPTPTHAQASNETLSPATSSTSRPPIPAGLPEPAPAAMDQIRDLPWSLQQKIPSISYSRHSYNESGQSIVVINGEQRRAGQQLANNLKLEEILADGVVLSFEGRRFKLPALSSWVNM